MATKEQQKPAVQVTVEPIKVTVVPDLPQVFDFKEAPLKQTVRVKHPITGELVQGQMKRVELGCHTERVFYPDNGRRRFAYDGDVF